MTDSTQIDPRHVQALMDNLVRQRERALNEAAEHAARADVAEADVERLSEQVRTLHDEVERLKAGTPPQEPVEGS